MRRQDALYAAACIGTIAFCVAFVLPQFTEHAVLWYYPLDRAWELTARPEGLAMDFYGRTLQGIVAWGIAVVASLAITRRVRTERLSQRMASLLAAWAIAFVVLVMIYYAWTLAFRLPSPSPIPDWYVPR
jgi:hypothetical protein